MSIILILSLIVASVSAWLSLAYVVPSCAVSTFRHRLWRLRDQVVDEIAAGKYEDPQALKPFVEELEAAIRVGPEVTLFRVWLLRTGLHRSGLDWRELESTAAAEMFDPSHLSEADREIATPHHADYFGAVARFVLLGSPSGWLVTVGFVFRAIGALIVYLLTKSNRKSDWLADRKSVVRTEVGRDVEPAIDILGRSDDRMLSAFV